MLQIFMTSNSAGEVQVDTVYLPTSLLPLRPSAHPTDVIVTGTFDQVRIPSLLLFFWVPLTS